jgi:hypothetical protein
MSRSAMAAKVKQNAFSWRLAVFLNVTLYDLVESHPGSLEICRLPAQAKELSLMYSHNRSIKHGIAM